MTPVDLLPGLKPHFDSWSKLSSIGSSLSWTVTPTILYANLKKKKRKWDTLHARLNSHYKARSYEKKKHKKIKAYRKSPHKEPTVNRCLPVNSRFKAFLMIGQRKAFYRQRIPESSNARKESVDIDILVTSRNGGRKIMQSIRITSRPPTRKRKWNQLSQFWRTSTKVIPIEQTLAGHISTMSEGFKKSSKWRTNSPAYSFW